MINVPIDPLTSMYDTNIFKAPEVMREVAPDMQVSETIPGEPEPLPMKKGICHL